MDPALSKQILTDFLDSLNSTDFPDAGFLCCFNFLMGLGKVIDFQFISFFSSCFKDEHDNSKSLTCQDENWNLAIFLNCFWAEKWDIVSQCTFNLHFFNYMWWTFFHMFRDCLYIFFTFLLKFSYLCWWHYYNPTLIIDSSHSSHGKWIIIY